MEQLDTIVGSWKFENGRVIEDEACTEIRTIIRDRLRVVGADLSGWFKLFLELETGQYWELDFPQSGSHGGGPPRLRKVNLADIAGRYDVSAFGKS
jgi:hypothetical protein